MEIRKFTATLITILNFAAEELEKLMSEDGEKKVEKEDKPARPSRGANKTSPKKDDDDEHPTEDDIVDAVRGAQKTLETAVVKKIIKTKGKADRASEVEPELRQAVIDALEKAIEDAE